MTKTGIFIVLLLFLFAGFMLWHAGRYYENQMTTVKFRSRDSITADAYNYYLLEKCLKGELDLDPNNK